MDKSKFSIQSLPEIIVASHREVICPTGFDIEYCEQVEKMGSDNAIIQFKCLDAVPKALCMKHVGPYERFHESFTEAFAYMDEQGYKMAGGSPHLLH